MTRTGKNRGSNISIHIGVSIGSTKDCAFDLDQTQEVTENSSCWNCQSSHEKGNDEEKGVHFHAHGWLLMFDLRSSVVMVNDLLLAANL